MVTIFVLLAIGATVGIALLVTSGPNMQGRGF